MFHRTFNQKGLEAEGLYREVPHEMRLFPQYKSPENVDMLVKPVVDVSVPYTPMDETHQGRKMGVQKLLYRNCFQSMDGYSGLKQEIPGANTLTNWDMTSCAMMGGAVMALNHFYLMMSVSGLRYTLPRFSFASMVWAYALLFRSTLTAGITVGGYLYSYEYLYTYVPGFKIKDPSYNAWARPWDEDQTTYRARMAACLFPAIGQLFHNGQMKFHKAACTYIFTCFFSLYWEYGRQNVHSGMRLFYSFEANKECDRQARLGSLMPQLERRNDSDTGKTNQADMYKYYRTTTGLLQDTVWANNTHETMPMHQKGTQFPNPYYNWQKAKQGYSDAPVHVKSQLWSLPEVMDARMRAGASDFMI